MVLWIDALNYYFLFKNISLFIEQEDSESELDLSIHSKSQLFFSSILGKLRQIFEKNGELIKTHKKKKISIF